MILWVMHIDSYGATSLAMYPEFSGVGTFMTDFRSSRVCEHEYWQYSEFGGILPTQLLARSGDSPR